MAKENQFRLKFNKKGFEDLRNDRRLKKDLFERGARIKDAAEEIGATAAAGEIPDGYVVTDLILEQPRGAVSVMAYGHAKNSNRKHNSLIRSLDAGR